MPLPDRCIAGDERNLIGGVASSGRRAIDTVEAAVAGTGRRTTRRRSPTTDGSARSPRPAARVDGCRAGPPAPRRHGRSSPLLRRSIVLAHPAYLYQVSSEELDHLRSENAELRRRVEAAAPRSTSCAPSRCSDATRFAGWSPTCRPWSAARRSFARCSSEAAHPPQIPPSQ